MHLGPDLVANIGRVQGGRRGTTVLALHTTAAKMRTIAYAGFPAFGILV